MNRSVSWILFVAVVCAGCVSDPPTTGLDAGLAQDASNSSTGDMSQTSTDMGDATDQGSDAGVETLAASQVRSMERLFLFNGDLADVLGNPDFSPNQAAPFDNRSPPEGSASLLINQNDTTIADNGQSMPRIASQLVVAHWIRHDDAQDDSTWLSRTNSDTSEGWSIRQTSGTTFECVAHAAVGEAISGIEVEDASNWNHVICEYDVSNSDVTVTATVNGITGVPDTIPFSATAEVLRFGKWPEASTFAGAMDELAFDTSGDFARDDALKLFACGNDGALCTCDGIAPANYVSCGRIGSGDECEALAPCSDG